MADWHPSSGLQRRVAAYHDGRRLDGMTDLVIRARGASVMDIGCNRGLVGYEFAQNGAALVHGCDNYEDGIRTAREVFADVRETQSQFECLDLSVGASALRVFGVQRYDITLCLATYHKLKRIMDGDLLTGLMQEFGRRTGRWFAWRGTSDKPGENDEEVSNLDRDLGAIGMRRIHTSFLSEDLGAAAIWSRR
jgi:SAM-dependent methyltransferase